MYIEDTLYFYRRDNEISSSAKPCGIRFAYQEYKRLCNLPMKCENIKLYYHYLYVRMVYVFIGEYEKLLLFGKEFAEEFREVIEWFQNILNEQVKKREITEADVDRNTWEKLELLISCEDMFITKWYEEQKRKEDLKNELLNRIGTEQIVIFGCGNYGGKSLLFCDKYNVSIAVFSDNNPNLWEKQFYGYEICRPTELNEKYSDMKILISSFKYEKIIRKQLKIIGVCEDRIISFSGIL